MNMFSSPAFRPAHARHPSAPVVVRPSHTPGVFNIAKPVQSAPRPQHTQAQARAPRVSPKSKPQQRSPQLAQAQAASVERTKAPTSSPSKVEQSTTSPEKSTRGRKQHKQSKDAGRRTSVSPSDVVARRHAHQPSPPPARIPSPQKAALAPRAQVSRVKPEDLTSSTDPFTDAVDATKTSGNSFAPPKLATQPSGKLARRRQATTQLLDSPTPKVGSRRKPAKAGNGERTALPQSAFNVAARPLPRRASTDLTLTRWDSFPICDDSSEYGDGTDTPPTTPIREVASVPPKAVAGATWQQESLFFDNVPHTAPLSSTYGFPPALPAPSTPTPAQRRRNHQRVPSEGMFAMSSDESSPSSSVVDLTEQLRRRSPVAIPRQRCFTSPAGSPAYDVAPVQQFASASAPSAVGGYFAGSVFQNSPSPDDLPVPSFAL
ncbi:hypothetical protein L226DRAFT_575631 [Lentinus tigrinus ALCF2SS1-7]|uniref:Uncharacterized protein n=1 Tax=Lentinus tigrinus ALCF2SS1-6 TaxID=1328759 RepID=A0A5C2SCL6_9APHY|nr:hypothetical protein L227DRAFT_610521 [Lentinus tigrinus ALCF2SS1-6]RPD69480.1 hypothetical protein L226DRAFT_575631 [Lentinus tigrinus ALCF2SS1-7]